MKAVIGSWEDRPYRLLAELAALRSRVAELQDDRAELEAQLESVREENQVLRELVQRDELEVVLSGS